jgi:hypothetical protein
MAPMADWREWIDIHRKIVEWDLELERFRDLGLKQTHDDMRREMNAEFGIPDSLEALETADIPAIAEAALKEAHFTYAVPRYMDQQACERLVGQMVA